VTKNDAKLLFKITRIDTMKKISGIFRQLFFICFLVSCQFGLYGQIKSNQVGKESSGGTISGKINQYNKLMPFEKLYLHTDKSTYYATDTIWFKAYLLNGTNNMLSEKSGIIYVELVKDNKVEKRIAIPAQLGLSWGQIPLNEQEIANGSYVIRAYTNWMQNFGIDSFFTKPIEIINTKSQALIINQQQEVRNIDGKKNVQINLQINDLNDKRYAFKNVSWSIREGSKTWFAEQVQTSTDGRFSINFNLPVQIKQTLRLNIADETSGQKTVIPLFLEDLGSIDLQFMPEGGHMIVGIPSVIGFKALSKDGLGKDVEGIILNSKNVEVAVFKSIWKGMGAFSLIAQPGETYTAMLNMKNGENKKFTLPAAREAGINLKVIQNLNGDSIKVTVNLSESLIDGKKYQLMGLVDHLPCFEASFYADKPKVTVMLAKQDFPSGLVHFTVFNEQEQPVAERLSFISNHNEMNISLASIKEIYSIRDSIALGIILKDKIGNPVPMASISIAVTDDSQVKIDSLENNLLSEVFLKHGVKGDVEDPAYYLGNAADVAKHLDLLLLTQGWTGYNWNEMLKAEIEPLFSAEPEFSLSGKVSSLSGKPLSGIKVTTLSSGKVRLLMDTLTNAQGHFAFKAFPKLDTISFFVQARNVKEKSNRILLHLDEFQPAKLGLRAYRPVMPWFVNTIPTVLNNVQNEIALKKQHFSISGENMLENVEVTSKKGIRNSQNLNGRGEADQVIDETEISATRETSLSALLLKEVTGLYLKTNKNADQEYYINSRRVSFVVDGLSIRSIYEANNSLSYYAFLQGIFSEVKLSDIVGIEVITKEGNVGTYNNKLLENTEQAFGNHAYIEITTRSGKGLFNKSMNNIAIYKPVPMNWPQAFYSPGYKTNTAQTNILDLRSTIFWQPHLLSSKNGEARTSFYAADRPGTYTVIIQASNFKGLIGFKRVVLTVK
jgi:hypothetical protein